MEIDEDWIKFNEEEYRKQISSEESLLQEIFWGRDFLPIILLNAKKNQRRIILEKYINLAEAGDIGLQIELADLYKNGGILRKNIEKALHWHIKVAEHGYDEYQVKVGKMYMKGEGCAKNSSLAIGWIIRAAQQGNTEAQFIVGSAYLNGYGISKNYDNAIEWYDKCVNQGNSELQYKIGISLLNSASPYLKMKHSEVIIRFLEYAGEQGHLLAQEKLGHIFSNFPLMPSDAKKSFHWYLKAATQGSLNAQIEIAKKYFFGEGVNIDYQEAIYWCSKASLQGNERAIRYLQYFKDQLKKIY